MRRQYVALVLAVAIACLPARAEASGFVGAGGGGSSGPPNVSTATGTLPVINGGTNNSAGVGAGGTILASDGTKYAPISMAAITSAVGGAPNVSAATGTLPVIHGGTGNSAEVGAGGTILASDGTKYAPATVAALVSGIGAAGWTYASPGVRLTTAGDHVGIGVAPRSTSKLSVAADATYYNIDFSIPSASGGFWKVASTFGASGIVYNEGGNITLTVDAGVGTFVSMIDGALMASFGDYGFTANGAGSDLAQNFTNGAFYVPRCATGAPSGTPTSVTGAAAMVVGGNHHLYAELTSGAYTQIDGGGGGASSLSATLAAGASTGGTAGSHSITFSSGDAILGSPPATLGATTCTSLGATLAIESGPASSSTVALGAYVSGDSTERFRSLASGLLQWSAGSGGVNASVTATAHAFAFGNGTSGTTTADLSAGTLTISGSAGTNGSIGVTQSTGGAAFSCAASGDTQDRLELLGGGTVRWSAGSGSMDTSVSRDSAGVVDFGTGAQGSKAGSLNATNGTFTGTLGIASGGGISFRGAVPGADQIKWGSGGSSAVPQILAAGDIPFVIQTQSNAPVQITPSGTGYLDLNNGASALQFRVSNGTPGTNPADGQVFVATDVARYVRLRAAFASGQDAMGVHFQKGSGTCASPGTVANNDWLGWSNVSGHDGSNYVSSSQMTYEVDGVVATADVPGRIVWSLHTKSGAAGVQDKLALLNGSVLNSVSGGVLGFSSSSSNPRTAADTGLSRDSAGVLDFGTGAQGSAAGSWKATNGTLSGTLAIAGTNTGTVGDVTINKATGRVNMGAGLGLVTVTDSTVTSASHIFLNADSAPGNIVAVMFYAVAGSGSFTVNAVPAVTNQTAIDFVVVN